MADNVIAVLSMLVLAVFAGILVGYVREFDLALIIVLCLTMGMHDFWATIGRKREAG